jgi:hypothetical protein
MRRTLLKWLVDKNTREIVSFIGGGIVVVVGATWTAYTYYSKQTPVADQGFTFTTSPVDTVRLTGKMTFRGYGFYTPRGYLVLDRIPSQQEQQLSAEPLGRAGDPAIKVQIVKSSESIPVALARPLGTALVAHSMRTRTVGSLAIGESVELYRAPNYTARGKVLRKFVDVEVAGARGTESRKGLLETTSIAAAGDSGAPVIDRDGRVVGILYAGSNETSLIVPIEQIMSEFPAAF